MKEFVEDGSNTFSARIELSEELNMAKLHLELNNILPSNALITVHPRQKKKMIIMVTKEHHCLTDLLIRHYFKEIHADIQAAIETY
jgi:formyltetrahydrofolate deformylase